MSGFQPPRGTRDLMPEEMARRRAVCDEIRSVFESFGYGEVCTPAFEDFALLAKKSGPEIEEEIYSFKDKSGRKLGLRFDPTVPICRIVASDPSRPKPVKLYYITNMWRYDRPGAGRWREFWQAGAELIGPASPEADAEILALVHESLKAIGIKDFRFSISSRDIIETFVKEAGIPDQKKFDVFRAIDKLGKTGEDAVRKEMKRYGVPVKAVSKLMEMIKTRKASGDDLKKLNAIRDCAKEMGINNTKIDFNIVRGIDYYTGFVFETFVKGYENLGSVASGGRYDSLIGIYSGRDIPATGFGIGIDRLFEIVDVKGKSEASGTKAFVVSVNDYAKKKAVWIAKRLRKSGINAETDLMGRDLRRQLDYANRKKIPYAVIVGPAEIKKRKFTLKDMKTGRESKLGLDGIAKKLRSS
jgi:histidyl-tRNA synthetase